MSDERENEMYASVGQVLRDRFPDLAGYRAKSAGTMLELFTDPDDEREEDEDAEGESEFSSWNFGDSEAEKHRQMARAPGGQCFITMVKAGEESRIVMMPLDEYHALEARAATG